MRDSLVSDFGGYSGKLFVRLLQALIDLRRGLHLGQGLAAVFWRTLRQRRSRNQAERQAQNYLRHKSRPVKSVSFHDDLLKSGKICAAGSPEWTLISRVKGERMSFCDTVTPAAIMGASTV